MGISMAEYERQANSGRFRVLALEEAWKRNVPGVSEHDADNQSGSLLIEFDGDTPLRVVGDDMCEPEDATLLRDFYWVAEEMNALATRAGGVNIGEEAEAAWLTRDAKRYRGAAELSVTARKTGEIQFKAVFRAARAGGGEAERWIPVSEQMPPDGALVAMLTPDGRVLGYEVAEGQFYRPGRSPYPLHHPEAMACRWTPLPTPPVDHLEPGTPEEKT